MVSLAAPVDPARGDTLIDAVWNRLSHIKFLTIQACPGASSRTAWRGHGSAHVQVESTDDYRRFIESGQFWPGSSAAPVPVRNVYLWQRMGASLLLSHERYGRDAPVFLLRLTPAKGASLAGDQAHQCAQDQYRATLHLTHEGLRLDWLVTGPRKDERLSQRYDVKTQATAAAGPAAFSAAPRAPSRRGKGPASPLPTPP